MLKILITSIFSMYALSSFGLTPKLESKVDQGIVTREGAELIEKVLQEEEGFHSLGVRLPQYMIEETIQIYARKQGIVITKNRFGILERDIIRIIIRNLRS